MRLRVICALLAAVLLGQVSVTASPMPAGNKRKDKDIRTMPLYLGLVDPKNNGWMDKAMTPKVLLKQGDPFLCFSTCGGTGYIQGEHRAGFVEANFKSRPSVDYFDKLTTTIFSQFKNNPGLHLKILGDAQKLSEVTGMVVEDRRSYYEALASYFVKKELLNEEDHQSLLNEIGKMVPELLLPGPSHPSTSNPPPTSNAPPPAGYVPPTGSAHPPARDAPSPISNASPAGNSASINEPDVTGTKDDFHKVQDDTVVAINGPMGNKRPAVNEPKPAMPKSDYLPRVLDHDPPSPDSNANKRPKLT
ncbi:hypothetical protein F5878DRAFT_404240 [Lentinula raphanica]|uniref:Uncharacterized protein n=1 Tax=Lentinula raphanica TaxID=153919 RepID=A0AA38UI79_9AGAR|nr:hypothetical protein EV360DRAFT_88733 [Lentinula raphanica]KAJ3842339.1 hypothetical protein F5878DRAFT_404240 [Lentinula raphanica]